MAIGKINGPMLQPNLERQGVNIAIDTDLTYWDVNNRYVGIKTDTPNYPLDVMGNVHIGNIYVLGNAITVDAGLKLDLGNIANITIAGGEANSVMFTDGTGNIAFGNLVSIMTLEGFSGNNIVLGSASLGDLSNAVTLDTTISVTDAISLVNQRLGNVQSNVTLLTTQVYSNANAASYLTVYGGDIAANVITANLFSGNVSGNIAGTNADFTYISGLLTTAEQTNITKLGIVSNLEVAGNTLSSNITATNNFYGNLVGDVNGSFSGNITGTTATFETLTGNILTATQPFITELGQLTNLTVVGNTVSGNISATTITGQLFGNIEGATASFSNIAGNITTSAQPYITSVGTLDSLAVSGNTTANSFVAASNFYGNVVADTITPYQTNIVVFNTQTAVKLPSGDISARPQNGAGFFRYNTTFATIEYNNGTEWVTINNSISQQQISPDGVTDTFDLSTPSSAEGLIVSINGTLQRPGGAYSVIDGGTKIKFAEIPLITDLIDVRFIASAGTTTLDFEIVDTANVSVGTSNVIVDKFSPTLYRSVKYAISSSNGTDASFLEAQVVQHNGVAVVNTSANVNTGPNSLTFYANVDGGLVNFIAKGTTASNQLRIQRIYFDV